MMHINANSTLASYSSLSYLGTFSGLGISVTAVPVFQLSSALKFSLQVL